MILTELVREHIIALIMEAVNSRKDLEMRLGMWGGTTEPPFYGTRANLDTHDLTKNAPRGSARHRVNQSFWARSDAATRRAANIGYVRGYKARMFKGLGGSYMKGEIPVPGRKGKPFSRRAAKKYLKNRYKHLDKMGELGGAIDPVHVSKQKALRKFAKTGARVVRRVF